MTKEVDQLTWAETSLELELELKLVIRDPSTKAER